MQQCAANEEDIIVSYAVQAFAQTHGLVITVVVERAF